MGSGCWKQTGFDPRRGCRSENRGPRYAPDLSDIEIEAIGRDPFLIAYAVGRAKRCVVTTESSAPKRSRQNRQIPDVCAALGVRCCDTFTFARELNFRTNGKP